MRQWASHTLDNVYKWGCTLEWLAARVPHGGKLALYARLGLTKNTAENWQRFARECRVHDRQVVPHWIRWKLQSAEKKSKSTTVVLDGVAPLLLAAPEEEIESKPKKKPRHDSEPLNWNAQECAERLLASFEKLTAHQSIKDMRDCRDALVELVDAFIEEREEDKRRIGGDDDE